MNLRIALFQTNLIWENPSDNINLLNNKVNAISQYIDLIVLPEMFTSGFTMNPKKVAQTMQGDAISWLKVTAKNKNCAITGSLVIEEIGNYYNPID